MSKPQEEYSEEEAERRFQKAIRHALTTPHKPQSELKLSKRGSKSVVKNRQKKA